MAEEKGKNVPLSSRNPPSSSAHMTNIVAVQSLQDSLSASQGATHPFSSSTESTLHALRGLVDATTHLSHSLTSQLPQPIAESKSISLFRQYTTIAHNVHLSDQTMRQTVESLRKRTGISYGEAIPLDPDLIIDWCISRLESWAKIAGMETFKDEREGHMSVVLGGKVLVVDIDFLVDRSTHSEGQKLDVAAVKTSYAVPNGASNTSTTTTEGSVSLDGFIADCIRAFLQEVQKPEESQDTLEAGRLGSLLLDHLKYLMRLDQLALREGDSGLRWFNGIDRLSAGVLEPLATKEAEVVSSSLSVIAAPLDIFLMRAHALPLPYLASPTISFLVYLSPLAYLTLLRSASNPEPRSLSSKKPNLPHLDVSLLNLRSQIRNLQRGPTFARLVLGSTSLSIFTPHPDAMDMHDIAARPTFPLVPMFSHPEYPFPEATDPDVDSPAIPNLSSRPPAKKVHRWFLDFTEDGKQRGVVMSQSRMREIESIVNPMSSLDALSHLPMSMGTLGSGSWVDLLLHHENIISPERYTSSYTSPTSAHPSLLLRLNAPDEPGFHLERVPVENIKQVWGILEVVREQCWLNEIINGTQWTPEGLPLPAEQNQSSGIVSEDDEVTEADLQAILGGTNTPSRIPVNIYIPTPQPADPVDPLFGTPDLDGMALGPSSTSSNTGSSLTRKTRIIMTSPERPPITGLVEVTVAYDCIRPKGVAVVVNGAMGVELSIDSLEEVCRRGGVLGLPGRIWSKAHGFA